MIEAVSFLVLFAAAGLCLARFAAGSDDSDDQELRFQGTSGLLAVAVFAPSGDPAPGLSPFNVLVQDRSTGDVLLDAAVELNAHAAADVPTPASTVHASYENSENKLLQSAEVNMAVPGDWMLNVVVRRKDGAAQFSLPIHVAKEEAEAAFPWTCGTLLAFAVILLLAYIRRHRAPKPCASLPRVA